MSLLRIFALLTLVPLGALTLTGCDVEAPGAAPLSAFEAGSSPAAPGSAQPNLYASGDHVYMSWLEPAADSAHALRFSRWEGNSWSEPRTIAQGDNYFVNWADFPSVIELPDGTLAAHWLVRSGSSTYAYDVYVSRSGDGGNTWSEPVIPHRDGTQTEHGFVSLFPRPEGGLSLVWLDGRKYAEAESAADSASSASGHGSPDSEMTLRYAAIDAQGNLADEVLLDGRTCDCCQTDAALTTAGPVVVYRDRSTEEIRDISIVRWVDSAWTEPVPVHRDEWHIAACPVNGPAIGADGEKVVVAWFTAADTVPRVKLAFSDDAGATFSDPVEVDAGDPVGRVDVELLPDGSALVSWLTRSGDGAEVRVRRVERQGTMGEPQTIATSSAARASGFPRMARVGDRMLFAWTEPGDPTRIRTAVAELAMP